MPRSLLALTLFLFLASHARATDPLQAFADASMSETVPTQLEALGHDHAERYTRHEERLDYCRALAASSERVRLDEYGRSHLGRTLVTLTITSAANHERLDEILEANRRLADPSIDVDARTLRDNPAIVWFSFGVHGNEGSNPEAAVALAYALAASEEEAVASWLDDVVVVIDPCLNPDGNARYISWFESVSGQQIDGDPDATEHFEPWPGGRSNHYLFDLNRDWVWGVHPESRARVAWYRQYLPHLHIDWHEQGYQSPTFFGEGDTPYNANIPESTKQWVRDYTVEVAEGYDALGLVYATRERFDYLYPGYGKVLPCYHGAVGILNEQAGHSRGGLAIDVEDSYTLTLQERVRNQLVIARSYIESTAERRRGQLERFREFFTSAMELSNDGPAGFVISADNTPKQIDLVWQLCQQHGIRVYEISRDTTLDGATPYGAPTDEQPDAPAGSWWIPVDQPMGRLALTLFERSSFIEDADTYDITGWSVPVMFGLEAWTVEAAVAADATPLMEDTEDVYDYVRPWSELPRCIAYVVPADQWRFPVALGLAAEHGLFARLTGDDMVIGDRVIPAGSLLAHTIRNDEEQRKAFVGDLIGTGLQGLPLSSGMTDSGPVVGANENRRFILPKIMLPRGGSFSSLSFGQVWHMLDVLSPIPHTVVPADRMGSVDVDEFNVLVLPSGNPSSVMDAEEMERWVRGGGTVVAIGSSARWVSSNVLDLEADEDESDEDDRPELSELTYEQREERGVEDRIPGAVFRAVVDTTHPLALNAGADIGVIKRSSTPLLIGDRGYAVARFAAPDPVVGGSVSQRNADRIAGTPFVTHHTLGGGNIICFSDDVTMRGFNHAGMRLLLHAISKGPSMAPGLQPLGHRHNH